MVTRRGFTLAEALVVVLIVGILFGIVPQMVMQVARFFNLNSARLELQRDARDASEQCVGRLRRARASTIVVNQAAGQPPFSRVSFETIMGTTVAFWQDGRNLMANEIPGHAAPRVITKNLRYISFTYVRTFQENMMSVNLSMEKDTFRRKRIYQASNEKVKILNE